MRFRRAAENLRISIFGSCVHRVCIFFITFLYNSCNFQYLILVRPLYFSALQLATNCNIPLIIADKVPIRSVFYSLMFFRIAKLLQCGLTCLGSYLEAHSQRCSYHNYKCLGKGSLLCIIHGDITEKVSSAQNGERHQESRKTNEGECVRQQWQLILVTENPGHTMDANEI